MKLDIIFHYEVDDITGEIKYIGKEEIKVDTFKSTNKKVLNTDTDTEPKLYLLENKYRLNAKAIALLKPTNDDRIDIKYEIGNIPVIGLDSVFGTNNGCKISKSNTVSLRGAKFDQLSKYGNEFTLIEHTDKEGLFILQPLIEPSPLNGDENVNIENVDINFNFEDLFLEEDADKKEIDVNLFKF